ncbi:hypothetical protein OU789_01405 [Halocynthiibacter sp. C4]|uniref:hypothetical protein n=1 Tax=Halocynthiibacter sp. C4 TaxID=2992758 RepID=UPI00237B3591|nr:hypothetical protein [Halocynthiibacter sp. C4]MDE0588575.1 hypothetical protein [Halocynthiibacter sp. C4]
MADSRYPFTISAFSCDEIGGLFVFEVEGQKPYMVPDIGMEILRSDLGFIFRDETERGGVPIEEYTFLERERNGGWSLNGGFPSDDMQFECENISDAIEEILPLIEVEVQKSEVAPSEQIASLEQELSESMSLLENDLEKAKIDLDKLRRTANSRQREIDQLRLLNSDLIQKLNARSANVVKGSVSSCWDVEELFPEARNTRITVEVEINADSTVNIESLSLRDFEGGSEQAAKQTLSSVRRAFIRCRGQKLNLPLDKISERRTVLLTFDPNEISEN